MRHPPSSMIFFIFCVVFTAVHAEEQPTAQDEFTSKPETFRSSTVNFFGSIYYALSNTGKLTGQVLYQTRDGIDRFVYDVRKYGPKETNQQYYPATNLENCLMLGFCGQYQNSPSTHEQLYPVHLHFQ